MKKLLLLLLLSLGLIGISYADDSQEAIEREIAEFEAELAAELAIQKKIKTTYRAFNGNQTCNEGYIRYENRCYKEGELPQDDIEREIAEFEAELAAELSRLDGKDIEKDRAFIAQFKARLEAELAEAALEAKIKNHQQNKDLLELEIAALEKAEAVIQYRQLLAREVKAEEEIANLIIGYQLNRLKSAYVNNISARVKSFWRYQFAQDDWTCEVYVIQDRQGQVEAVDVRNCNVGDSARAKSFRDSIERAVYKASPLPAAPDDAVFDRELFIKFSVN